jgi:glycosyltransferase involved in cell wall biosynthesis
MELALRSASDGLTHFHAHFATDAAAVARLASRITEIPYTVTAHAKDIFHESVDRDVLFDRLGDARHVVTVSNYNVGFLDAAFGNRLNNVTRIYNGMDLEQFTYLDPEERPPTILGVGRLVEKKGFDYLIEAAGLLKSQGIRFDCRILGHGELHDQLQTLIDKTGVGDVVRLEGPRPSADVIKALNGASVLAAPCVVGSDGNRDGLPTVLLEAMAVGTPCVSTDVTGIPEVIIDGSTGLQVPQHDAEALARALTLLVHDGSLRSRLAREARGLIEREFDIRKNTSRIRELFGCRVAIQTGDLAEVA